MTRITTAAIATLATAALATTAHAGDMSMKKSDYSKSEMRTQMQPQSRTTTVVKTIDADGQVGTMQVVANDMQKTAVLGAFAEQKTDAYVVEAPNGELFINHIIPMSELPNPRLDPEVVDTYTYEYNGMTFTNRVVREQ